MKTLTLTIIGFLLTDYLIIKFIFEEPLIKALENIQFLQVIELAIFYIILLTCAMALYERGLNFFILEKPQQKTVDYFKKNFHQFMYFYIASFLILIIVLQFSYIN